MMKVRSSSFQHRVRVAKRVLAKRGCIVNRLDGNINVTFPTDIIEKDNTCICLQTEQSLIDLALKVLKAEKDTGISF
jgi:hypothetical protein